MGGPVAIAFRTNEGKVHTRSSWTGWIQDFFDNTRFLDEDPTHLEWFLEHNPDDFGLSPDGYGLVVGDMVSKTIISSQGYTSLGKLYGASISLSMHGRIIGEEEGNTKVDIFNEMYLAKRIARIEYRLPGNMGELKLLDFSNMSPKDILDFFQNFQPTEHPYWDVILDTNPYTIEDLGEGRSALKAFRSRLIELDFKLTNEDNEGWEEYIRDTYDDEDEEYDDD